MAQVIIYPQANNVVTAVYSTGVLPIEEVCRKDVPAGVPYKIVDSADLPTDMTFRDAWEADFSNPDGVGIGADAWFAEQAEIKAAEEAAQQQAQEEVANDNNQP